MCYFHDKIKVAAAINKNKVPVNLKCCFNKHDFTVNDEYLNIYLPSITYCVKSP